MKIGYIRVSTLDQNLERQTEVMKSEGAERIFQDKASGKNNDRPQLKKMLESLRSGDVVIVKSVDRMARSYSAFYLIWEEIKEKGASLRVVDLGMTLDNSPMTAFLVSIMAAVAELERGMIRERQKEGVKIAKEKGVYTGRKPDIEKHNQIIKLRRAGLTVDEIVKTLKVGRATVFRVMKLYTDEEGVLRDPG
ncbi:hypothetical protein BSR03_17255 [Serratia proteamaculans]|uniref:recombinase family protein n=1 Tax=Serratia proteamaculans TaxID=28151 RepID=UPI0010E23FD3|nr:recombinase family protein [Serratia proteamaculans]RYM60191.1 hypothetical protein BSR03_17255 [Serratia proteamaculans]